MSNLNLQTVTSVHDWTDTQFSSTCTHDLSFRFENDRLTVTDIEVVPIHPNSINQHKRYS